MHKIGLLVMMLLLAVLPAGADPAKPLETSRFPSLAASIRVEAPLDFCGEPIPLERSEVMERLEKELLLALWDRAQVILWIKRSGRYFPIIERLLAENRLPGDLKYLAVIESALRPHAGSSKGAIGFWQFLKATGRRYDLRIDRNIDERRNLFASTRAAIRYFKDLHQLFGSWTLAAAAYNMGEKGLQTEVMAQKTTDFYRLYLSLETQRYIFKILAAKMILDAPEKYGFFLSPEELYAPLAFDRIEIKCTRATPIQVVAAAAGTYFSVIKGLNPELRGRYLAKGRHTLLIPEGTEAGFEDSYGALLEQWQSKSGATVYVVRRGDNLSAIAERFRVPLPALLMWNRLNPKKPIHPGQRLVVYSPSRQAADTPEKQ